MWLKCVDKVHNLLFIRKVFEKFIGHFYTKQLPVSSVPPSLSKDTNCKTRSVIPC